MKRQIKLNDREITLKSSAATNILYKKAFGEDILVKLTAYTKNVKELKAMQTKIAELKNDTNKTQEEKLAIMNEMVNSDVFISSNKFTQETLPRLAYIMYIEANTSIEDIFSKLNGEQYLIWLMSIDQDELTSLSGEVMDLWQAGAKTHSTPKN